MPDNPLTPDASAPDAPAAVPTAATPTAAAPALVAPPAPSAGAPVSTALAPTGPVLTGLPPAPEYSRTSFFGPQWVGPGRSAGPAVLAGAGVSGLVAAAAMPWDRPGIGWFATAVLAATATAGAVWARGRAPDGNRADRGGASVVGILAWALAAVALVSVGAVLDAWWLFVLCLLTACLCGSLALSGGRSVRGLFLGVVAVPIAAIRCLPWASRGVALARGRAGGSAARTAAAVVVGLALLFLFGALFAGADAAFAKVVDNVLPTVNAGVVFRWLFSFTMVGLGTLGGCFLALAPPAFDGEAAPRRSLRRVEWALPVGGLVVLFAAFVSVQATILFGGGDHVLRTTGLTYAEYARGGFWQLLAVTVLALVVIGVAARLASRQTLADRVWLRVVLGGLAVLTLVVVASALSRMWAYEQAYGFTRLRLLVSVCELWLGVVFILVLAAGARLRGRVLWLPSAVIGTAVAALLGIAVLNPDRFIAEQNVAQYLETKRIDLDYLSDLSSDAVPALLALPQPLRSCALDDKHSELNASADDWREWNLARHQARLRLADHTSPTPAQWRVCWDLSQATGP